MSQAVRKSSSVLSYSLGQRDGQLVPRAALRRCDPWLLGAVGLLLALSCLMVFSTTAIYSDQQFGSPTALIRRHLIHMILGIVVMGAASRLPPRMCYRFAAPMFLLSGILLLLVLIPGLGSSAGGAQRWLVLGPLRMQPGEFAKVATVIFIASYLHRQQHKFASFKTAIVTPMALYGVIALLLLAQPDFGSTAVLGMVVFSQLCLAARLSHLFAVGFAGALAGISLILISPYRMKRLITFLDPFQDPSSAGYQLIQSLIAVGAGGLAGAGIGAGKQKLFYLPAAHTDFIYAVIAEELGFLGGAGVLAIFLFILWRGLDLANALREQLFYSALAFGLTLLIVLPALLNMGVVLGLLPTKGLVLPLIAYGGTSMVIQLGIVGLLLGISRLRED